MKIEEARALAKEYVFARQAEYDHKCGFANDAFCDNCSHLQQGYIDGLIRGSMDLASLRQKLGTISEELKALIQK